MMMNEPRYCGAERHMRGLACQGREEAAVAQVFVPPEPAACFVVPALCHAKGLDSVVAICTLGGPRRSSSLMTKPTQRKDASSPERVRTTTAEATVAALIAHDIDTIYALPGVHNDSLFDALFRASDRIRTVHTRHEQGAAYMALGAALATAKPQAYAVVPGPGLLNSAAALLTAYGMNAPVLALIGQIAQSAIGRGLGHLHEIRDQRGIIERLVDFCARIRQPGDAAGLVAQAVLALRTGRPGPAVLECAMDVWGRDAPIAVAAPLPVPQPTMDEEAIRDAA